MQMRLAIANPQMPPTFAFAEPATRRLSWLPSGRWGSFLSAERRTGHLPGRCWWWRRGIWGAVVPKKANSRAQTAWLSNQEQEAIFESNLRIKELILLFHSPCWILSYNLIGWWLVVIVSISWTLDLSELTGFTATVLCCNRTVL